VGRPTDYAAVIGTCGIPTGSIVGRIGGCASRHHRTSATDDPEDGRKVERFLSSAGITVDMANADGEETS